MPAAHLVSCWSYSEQVAKEQTVNDSVFGTVRPAAQKVAGGRQTGDVAAPDD